MRDEYKIRSVSELFLQSLAPAAAAGILFRIFRYFAGLK